MKKAIITGILAIAAACLVLGCGKKEEAKEPEKAETESNDDKEVEKEEEYQIIGKESEDACKLLLTNRTGDEITGFAIKASAAQEAGENLLDAGKKIEKEETVCVYYTPEKTEDQSQTTYDFNLSYADGHVVEIAGLGLDDLKEAELCFEDEVGFVKYKDAGSGKEVSTKEMALALKAQKQAEAAAEEQKKKEEAEKAAAEAAAAQAQADAQQYEQQYYEPEYPQYYEPQYEEPPQQGGEGCLTDPVINPNYVPN